MDYRDKYSQDKFSEIRWRIHMKSRPEIVHRMLSTNTVRASFWAESAEERNGVIEFKFIDGLRLAGKIIENKPPYRFVLEYWNHSHVTFDSRMMVREGQILIWSTLRNQKDLGLRL